MKELESMRESLSKLSQDLLKSILKRKEIVKDIQQLKDQSEKFYAFDGEQERKLFVKFKNALSQLSLKELLAYSLLIEDHACVEVGAYPQWSQGIHLESNQTSLSGMVNPILLATIYKDEYDKLPLNDEFKKLLESEGG